MCCAAYVVHAVPQCACWVQNTELKFDLVSPVDELAKQIRMEFDFVNEASVMDAIASNLQASGHPCDAGAAVGSQLACLVWCHTSGAWTRAAAALMLASGLQ